MTDDYTWISKTWDHYNSDEIQQFHRRVQQEFGWLNHRWGFKLQTELHMLSDPIVVNYWFEDPHDATVFALKYL